LLRKQRKTLGGYFILRHPVYTGRDSYANSDVSDVGYTWETAQFPFSKHVGFHFTMLLANFLDPNPVIYEVYRSASATPLPHHAGSAASTIWSSVWSNIGGIRRHFTSSKPDTHYPYYVYDTGSVYRALGRAAWQWRVHLRACVRESGGHFKHKL